MKISNSTKDDVPEIFRLYRLATTFQKEKKCVQWPEFSVALVTTEVAEKRQWKLIIDQQVACVWAITFNDPEIWGEKDADRAIYIHRIATNPDFRGLHLVEHIVTWSKAYAQENKMDYIWMDTVGENLGLISHYKKCGFEFLGLHKLEDTKSLPAHYHYATVSLFQIPL